MPTVSELMSRNISNAMTNVKTWGGVIYNVKEYGAVGDGSVDDSNAIVKAIAAAYESGGGTIYFPPGKYLIESQIVIELNDPAWQQNGLNIVGDGGGSTVIVCGVPLDFAIHVKGIHGTNFRMRDVNLIGASLTSNRGIHLSFLSEGYIENVYFYNLFLGLAMTDCVRMKFVSCTFNQNMNGLYGNNQIIESTPNAIDLFGCCFYGNGEVAAYFYGGCNINFFGGTVEVSGHRDTGSNRWGVKIENGGRYGGAICNFHGVYFEGNANIADVWLVTDDYDGTYVFTGCTFNRFAPPKVSQHCIRLDADEVSGRKAKLVVIGCSFEERGYTTTTSTRYIEVYGKANVEFEQLGNYYQTRDGIPDIYSNRIFASARFVQLSTTPALYRGFNISGISKNGTGDYTVTFKVPSVVDPRIKTASIDGVGFVQCLDLTGTTMQIKVFSADGSTPMDPTELNIMVME